MKRITTAIANWFSSLTYPRKFNVITVIFLLPIIAFLPLIRNQTERIDRYGTHELFGTLYLRSLWSLTDAIQQHQVVSLSYLNGEAEFPEVQAAQGLVVAKFEYYEFVQSQEILSIEFRAEEDSVQSLWTALKGSIQDSSTEEILDSHGKILDEISLLVSRIGDYSYLILDPDLDTYYTMDAVLLNLPQNQTLLTEARTTINSEFPRHPGPREADNASYLAVLDDSRRIRLPLKRLRALLEPLLEWLDASQVGEGLRLKRAHSGELDELGQASLIWRGAEPLQRQLAQLRERRVRVDPPDGFQAELRPYQRDGLDWLGFLAAAKLGGILADDMGLGKTVQVLAHVLAEKQAGRLADPALVVAPTSLVPNWRNEARRFAPDLRVLVLHGSGRDVHFERMAEHDLVITSYPLLPRDRELLIAQPFGLLILDEAETIKNARTQAARVVRELKVPRRLAMTGTPLENHLGELWAQMDAVEPGVLGSERQFNRLYRNPIEKHQDSDRQQRLNRRIAR